MKGFQVDIVISPIKELKQQVQEPHVIASSKTQRHLRTAPATTISKSATDPWLEPAKDPWANFPNKGATASSVDTRPRLEALRAELCNDIKNKVTKDMEHQAQALIQAAATSSSQASSSQEDRLQALEVGLHELQGQNAKFTTWFQQAGDRMQATENAVTAVQHTLNAHQHELHTLGTTFQSTMKTIKNDLSEEMNESFNKQLTRLEALLEKKQRNS